MWFKRNYVWLVLVVVACGDCNAITNSPFNASLRDYAARENIENTTQVNTLQKEYQRNAYFTPMAIPVKYKEIPDSALAPSLSHGRGLLHHNHHGKFGYGIAEYEDGPHSGYGYEYHFPDEHDGHHDGHHVPDHHHHVELHHDHHGHHPYHDDHKFSYGHHHKHYDHALATKAVLWPIAGIALLGAAAALVSNPVLLQLGVVSGKRRRRDTEEYIDEIPHISNSDFQRYHEKKALAAMKIFNIKRREVKATTTKINDDVEMTTPHNRQMKNLKLKKGPSKVKKILSADRFEDSKEFDDKQYIPIPLRHRN